MDILIVVAGLVIGAAAAWQIAQGYAAAEMSRLRAQLEERIGYWQDQAERARADADLLAEKTAAWVAGCGQGREDALALAHALSQLPCHRAGTTPGASLDSQRSQVPWPSA